MNVSLTFFPLERSNGVRTSMLWLQRQVRSVSLFFGSRTREAGRFEPRL